MMNWPMSIWLTVAGVTGWFGFLGCLSLPAWQGAAMSFGIGAWIAALSMLVAKELDR